MLANRVRSSQEFFEINHSCSFRSSPGGSPTPTSYLTQTSTAGNRRTFTFSFWMIPNTATQDIIEISDGSFANIDHVAFDTTNQPSPFVNVTSPEFNSVVGSSTVAREQFPFNGTTLSSWVHVVFAVDTTTSIASQRIRMWWQGQEYEGSGNVNDLLEPTQNTDLTFGTTGLTMRIAAATFGSGDIADSLDIAEFHYVDGLALGPDSFARTVSGVYRPIQYNGSHGTSGFHLTFSNSSNLGEDSSGNGNDFTVVGSPTQSTDTPTTR